MTTLTKVYKKGWTDNSTWIINTPGEFATNTLFYVQEVGHFKCTSDFYTEHKNISSFLTVLTLNGEANYKCKKNYILKKGDLLWTDCMRYHNFTLKKSGNWDMLFLQFNGNSADALYRTFEKTENPIVHISENSKFCDYYSELIDANKNISSYSELISSKIITCMLTDILIESGAIANTKTNIPQYIQSAIQDINSHFTDNLSLDHFENTQKVSKYHFLKEFKKYTGYTPNEYLRITRINQAKNLLKFSDMSINKISEETGFQNVGYFINTFKKIAGTTPLKFRTQTDVD